MTIGRVEMPLIVDGPVGVIVTVPAPRLMTDAFHPAGAPVLPATGRLKLQAEAHVITNQFSRSLTTFTVYVAVSY